MSLIDGGTQNLQIGISRDSMDHFQEVLSAHFLAHLIQRLRIPTDVCSSVGRMARSDGAMDGKGIATVYRNQLSDTIKGDG